MTTTADVITEQWLSDVLTELGTSADHVAATLRSAKVTGTPRDHCSCPIARYVAHGVREHVPSAQVEVSVYDNTVSVEIDLPDPRFLWVLACMPAPVRTFVTAFDTLGGPYTDLIAEPAA